MLLFSFFQQRDLILFHLGALFVEIAESFCYFASLCSGSQTLTHPPSTTPFGFSFSLSLSVFLFISISPLRRSAKVGRLLAFGKASKDASSVVTPKIRGERCSRLSLVGDTELDPFQTKTEQNEPSQKDTPRRIIHFENVSQPFLSTLSILLYRSLASLQCFQGCCATPLSGGNGGKFENHWSPRGLRHCPPVGPF